MKLPLEHEPFMPVTLSRLQEQELQWLSDTLLDETLAERDEYVHTQNRVLDKYKWKQTMTRENVTFYKCASRGERGGYTPDVNLAEPRSKARNKRWRQPMCIGVGTIVGSVDDILYGALAPSSTDRKVRSTYARDDVADTRLLATIAKPTAREPMRSLCLRWDVLSQAVHKVIVAPRDFVYLDSIGTRTLPDGERIGFMIQQSVDVPDCEELKGFGLTRASYSTGFVFRDVGNGTTEVYMRAFMDPGGKLSDSIPVFSASTALDSLTRMVIAGQNKKLAYVVRTSLLNNSWPVKNSSKGHSSKECPMCTKSISGFRSSAVRCDLCQTKLCSRCVDKRKLTHVVKPYDSIVRVATMVCKACVTMANKMNAVDLALIEQIPDEADRTVRFHSNRKQLSNGSFMKQHKPMPQQPKELHDAFHSPKASRMYIREHSRLSQSSDTVSCTSTGSDWRRNVSYASHPDADAYPTPSPSCSRSASRSVATVDSEEDAGMTVDRARLDMWKRMNQLRVTAEETYQLTRNNSNAGAADTNDMVLYAPSTRPGRFEHI